MKSSPFQSTAAELRTFALGFPETNEEFPWGESAFKVKGKVFVFMRAGPEGLSMSMKLPQSNATALDQPFAAPTGYGLGKSGWVSCTFEGSERVPIDVLKPWIVESYRAVAPKTLVKRLDAGGSTAPAAAPATSKSTLPRKVAAKSAPKPPAKPTKKPGAKSSTTKKLSQGKPAATPARKRS